MLSVNENFNFQTTEDYLCLIDPEDENYNCRYKGWFGGRGGGKTIQLIRGALFRGTIQSLKILCTREYQISIADSIKSVLEDQIIKLGFEQFYCIQDKGVHGKNGTEFIFKGLKINSKSIRSMQGINLCLVMEAQTISEDSWVDLIPTIREDNSEIWIEWNPFDDNDPIQKRFVDNQPPNSFIKEVNYDRNPWFPDVLRAEMEYDKERDYSLYLHIWEGQTQKLSESLVFTHYRIDGTIAPSDKDILYYGSDFGFSVDPTTLVRMWINDENRELYIDYEAYGIGVEIDDIPALYDKVPGSRKWTITADSARPETISYLKRNGFKMRASKKGKGSVDEGVKFLQSYNIVIHPRCIHTISEFRSYSWKVNKKTNEILPILKDENNHFIDACRYALEQLFRRVRIHIGSLS